MSIAARCSARAPVGSAGQLVREGGLQVLAQQRVARRRGLTHAARRRCPAGQGAPDRGCRLEERGPVRHRPLDPGLQRERAGTAGACRTTAGAARGWRRTGTGRPCRRSGGRRGAARRRPAWPPPCRSGRGHPRASSPHQRLGRRCAGSVCPRATRPSLAGSSASAATAGQVGRRSSSRDGELDRRACRRVGDPRPRVIHSRPVAAEEPAVTGVHLPVRRGIRRRPYSCEGRPHWAQQACTIRRSGHSLGGRSPPVARRPPGVAVTAGHRRPGRHAWDDGRGPHGGGGPGRCPPDRIRAGRVLVLGLVAGGAARRHLSRQGRPVQLHPGRGQRGAARRLDPRRAGRLPRDGRRPRHLGRASWAPATTAAWWCTRRICTSAGWTATR